MFPLREPAPGLCRPRVPPAFLGCGHITQCLSLAMWRCSLCPPLFLSRHLSFRSGPLIQRDRILTNYSNKGPDCFQIKPCSEVLCGHELGTLFIPGQGAMCQKQEHRCKENRRSRKTPQVACWLELPGPSHWGPLQSAWNAPLNCPRKNEGLRHLSPARLPRLPAYKLSGRPCDAACHVWPWWWLLHGRGCTGAVTLVSQQLAVTAQCSHPPLRTPLASRGGGCHSSCKSTSQGLDTCCGSLGGAWEVGVCQNRSAPLPQVGVWGLHGGPP